MLVLETVCNSLKPYFSYVGHQKDLSTRGYDIVVTREYENEQREFKELGIAVTIKERDLRLAGDKLAAIPGMVFDAFAKAERSRGWTWNQATLVGYC